MLIYCDGCGAKYQIDMARITGDKAKARCRKCGGLIDLNDFRDRITGDEEDETPIKSQNRIDSDSGGGKAAGETFSLSTVSVFSGIGFKIVFPFIMILVLAGSGMTFLYLGFVPEIISKQMNLRAEAVTKSFSSGIIQHLMLRNYLEINRTASRHADFQDVAYVAVINKKNAVVAGVMNNKEEFDQEFRDEIEKKGFPEDIFAENAANAGSEVSIKDIHAGGRKVIDASVRIPDDLGVVHIGLFKEKAEKEILDAFRPIIILLSFIAMAGVVILFFIIRGIIAPVNRLTRAAQKIALGKTDEPIVIEGQGEIEALSASLEMMRQSINMAIARLRRKKNA